MTRFFHKVLQWLIVPALLLAGALVPTGDALALERGGYSMEVLIGGTPVYEHAARGTSYIEALKNREYSVRLRNRTAERIAIALSVDGLNSIDARTTMAGEARKWVLGPYETITLDGWQTSSATARRFYFTTEEKSYGNWLGRTQNLGLVAAAVFRERRQPISSYSGPRYGAPAPRREDSRAQGDESNSGPAPMTPQAPMGQAGGAEAQGSILPRHPDDLSKKSDDLAATGIGQVTSHPVREVFFDSEDSPTAVLELRYEYRDSLVRLGVLPADDRCCDSLSRRERARGFQEPAFAPDPYRRRDR
ncbi:MAG: hypothetical protein HYS34_05875 [Acidobacteria bacterium]|nr:hypothetical protein [Acidobacteriota bacterium]